MRWPVFLVFAFVFIIIEMSLRELFVLRSVGHITPSFMIVLMVYVAMFAPRVTALWAAWLMGLLVDLTHPLEQGAEQVGPLIGAHALGYVFACFLVLQFRALLFRRRALTLALMTMMAFAAASLVVVFVYAIHGWYPNDELVWAERRPSVELTRRLGIAVYSGVLALVLSRVLGWTLPTWGFRAGSQRQAVWR